MSNTYGVVITLTSVPTSDGGGFVGVVSVGEHEAYRTTGVHALPGEAVRAARSLLSDALASSMAAQEWRTAHAEHERAPRETARSVGARAPVRMQPDWNLLHGEVEELLPP